MLGVPNENPMNKRLFTFGCSFTQYKWPTWADIVGREFEEFQNWGKSGAGNQYIFNSIIECDIKNKFSHDDTVIVMWSNVAREDRYINGRWLCPGNIFTQSAYPKEFINEFFDLKGFFIRDIALIHSIKEMLQSRCKLIFLSMVPLTNSDQYKVTPIDDIDDILNSFSETLKFIRPSVYQIVFDYDWYSREFREKNSQLQINYDLCADDQWPTLEKYLNQDTSNIDSSILDKIAQTFKKFGWHELEKHTRRSDHHPTPTEHLEYLDIVLPEIYVDVTTREWVKKIDHLVRDGQDFESLFRPTHEITRW